MIRRNNKRLHTSSPKAARQHMGSGYDCVQTTLQYPRSTWRPTYSRFSLPDGCRNPGRYHRPPFPNSLPTVGDRTKNPSHVFTPTPARKFLHRSNLPSLRASGAHHPLTGWVHDKKAKRNWENTCIQPALYITCGFYEKISEIHPSKSMEGGDK